MTVLEYVYLVNFKNNEFWKKEFANKKDCLEYITEGYCPTKFIENFKVFKPYVNDNSNCKVFNQSQDTQKKECLKCWNQDYIDNSIQDDYLLYLQLKEKYEK